MVTLYFIPLVSLAPTQKETSRELGLTQNMLRSVMEEHQRGGLALPRPHPAPAAACNARWKKR